MVLALAAAAMIPASSASAWVAESGNCTWSTSSIQLGVGGTSGTYRDTLKAARDNYNATTDVTITVTTSSSPAWQAYATNLGATGWEGQETRLCLSHKIHSSMRMNTHYAGSRTATNKKVIWLHEIGHGLGLGHVSSAYRVMYKSASEAYSNGITSLTSDEKAGINALY